ncbi:MAG TPA: kelch repeat-containing protein [Candidatus Angelobacter sp.]|jgi:N-acetylneuraminic acid mutarotase|nr:kelch repeat-containing protein [Candidatus Angelobacter sp.]
MNGFARFPLAFFTLLALMLTSASSPTSTELGRVMHAASMHDRRADHTSTLLPDGRVLIVGGMVENGVFLNSAELFDPGKGTFVAAASMQSRRVGHSATLLPNRKVLIAGGLAGRVFEGGPGIVATAEIYDPATGRFMPGPSMRTPRTGHAAVLLPNGKVLVAGGEESDEHGLASAEIFDPAANKWTATGSMLNPRIARSAVVLKDGRVLVTGGGNGRNLAEIYDPASGVWHATGNMTAPRLKHAATLLPDGRVLITGGSPDSQWHPVRTAEVFDPRTNKFTAISDMELARFKIPDATAVLKNGRILVAGGAAEVEVYDNAAGRFFRAGNLDEAHFFASTTLLKDGRALITGGYMASRGRPNGPLSSEKAWLYVPSQ